MSLVQRLGGKHFVCGKYFERDPFDRTFECPTSSLRRNDDVTVHLKQTLVHVQTAFSLSLSLFLSLYFSMTRNRISETYFRFFPEPPPTYLTTTFNWSDSKSLQTLHLLYIVIHTLSIKKTLTHFVKSSMTKQLVSRLTGLD